MEHWKYSYDAGQSVANEPNFSITKPRGSWCIAKRLDRTKPDGNS